MMIKNGNSSFQIITAQSSKKLPKRFLMKANMIQMRKELSDKRSWVNLRPKEDQKDFPTKISMLSSTINWPSSNQEKSTHTSKTCWALTMRVWKLLLKTRLSIQFLSTSSLTSRSLRFKTRTSLRTTKGTKQEEIHSQLSLMRSQRKTTSNREKFTTTLVWASLSIVVTDDSYLINIINQS